MLREAVPQNRWSEYAHPALIIWGLYVFLSPFYVFTSGLPQPGDMFVLLLLPVAFAQWDGRMTRPSLAVFKPLLWFTIWVCIVDYGWALVLGNFKLFGTDTFVLYPLYYIYNTMIFLAVLVLSRKYGDTFLRVTLYAIYATIAVQVFAALVLRQGGHRGSAFFNNPNQLGYYALLAACLIVLLHWRLGMRVLISGLVLMGCGYLALSSASRSAVGGIAILFALLVFTNPRMFLAASIAGLLLVSAGGPISDAIDRARVRAAKPASHLTFWEERGYDRIWNHKEYLVLGAGEGGLSRFDTPTKKMQGEMHSSIGTILFSYGIVGVFLFGMFMWQLGHGASWRMLLVLVPPFAYAVAHQSLRFTLLWVMLAIFAAIKPRAPAHA